MAKHRLTVEALVVDKGRVLLVRQGAKRAGEWEMPGGKVKSGESIAAAVIREVLEETRVTVSMSGIVAVFFVEDELRHDVIVRCDANSDSEPTPHPPEIIAAQWFPLDQLPEPMRPFTTNCIRRYQATENPLTLLEIHSEQWLGH